MPAQWGGRGGGWGVVSYLSALARRARSRRSPLTVQRWPCRGAPLVVSSAEGATRRSVTVCRDRPAPQPLREQEQIRAVLWQSQGVSIGAPKVSQSEDWIANVRRRVVSQAGVFTRAYPRNAATDWSYERALLHRVPNGVLRGIATIQQASLSYPLCWRVQIGSR